MILNLLAMSFSTPMNTNDINAWGTDLLGSFKEGCEEEAHHLFPVLGFFCSVKMS